MLNVALVGLLAGSLAIGGGDSKNPQTGDKPVVDNAVPGIFTSSDALASETPDTVQDTYAFGIANRATPLRFWGSFGLGTTDTYWNTAGDSDGPANNIQLAGTDGKIETQRAVFGAELGLPVNLFGFGIGAGAQLAIAKNKFIVDATQAASNNPPIPGFPAGGFITGDLSSGFSLQGVKVYGVARAGAIGLHGGYVFDLGNDRTLRRAARPALGGAVASRRRSRTRTAATPSSSAPTSTTRATASASSAASTTTCSSRAVRTTRTRRLTSPRRTATT